MYNYTVKPVPFARKLQFYHSWEHVLHMLHATHVSEQKEENNSEPVHKAFLLKQATR